MNGKNKAEHSISAGFLAHAQATFLPANQVDAFIDACATPLRISIRINTLKISCEQFFNLATEYGWRLIPIPWCESGFWLDQENSQLSYSASRSPAHLQGLFYIQEASSMLPPQALLADALITDCVVDDGEFESIRLLDMAAAPGSKTTQLAALMHNRGQVLANELSASRLKVLHANLLRCGVVNTSLCHWDGVKLGDYAP